MSNPSSKDPSKKDQSRNQCRDHVVTVRGLELGSGRTKIIVPITERTEKEAVSKAQAFSGFSEIDLVELRIDFLEDALNSERVAKTCRSVQEALAGKPLIITFRTKSEGGETSIDDLAYVVLYKTVLNIVASDFIDVELQRSEAAVQEIIQFAHSRKTFVIVSNHDFAATPPELEIISRLKRMEELGADVLKLAAMPKHAGDVLTILSATLRMRAQTGCPIITMSMAGLGAISRLACETFGSAATFAMVGKSSAPGQMDVQEVSRALNLVHAALAVKD